MQVPLLQPFVNLSDSYLSGNVIVHPSAVIAPGVIIQAAPDSRIVIGEGVCIGSGAILNAYQGTIEVENGAVLGSGVLVIGKGTIGKGACVGAATTIFNASVKAMDVIAPGSLIGDTSRQIAPELNGAEINESPDNESNSEIPVLESKIDNQTDAEEPENISQESEIEEPEIVTEEPSLSNSENSASEDNSKPNKIAEKRENPAIFGKLYVNQLLVNLFPQDQNFNSPPPEQKSN